VLSPESGLDSLRRLPVIAAGLIPASGDQDHTTSPSALAALVLRSHCVHRIPRPTFVTIAKRPSCGAGWRIMYIALNFRKGEIFLASRLDTNSENQPVGQIGWRNGLKYQLFV